jgi:hypothetical protein
MVSSKNAGCPEMGEIKTTFDYTDGPLERAMRNVAPDQGDALSKHSSQL